MACSEAAELVTGHVYVIFATIAKPPKDKLTICVCAGKNLFLWINTKRNDRQDGQLPLRADDHGVLDRDCFLDCSFVSTFPPVSLASARDRGPISDDLRNRIIEMFEQTPPRRVPRERVALIIASLRETPQERYSDGGLNPNP